LIVDRCNNLSASWSVIVENRYYLHKNHLWSVVAITDNSWSLVSEYSYNLYWSFTLSWSDIWNTILFTWREYDKEINLYYYRARYYDSELWRFISRDPIWQVDDVNLYGYVGNNPVMFVDRMGLEKVLIFVWNDKKNSSIIEDALIYEEKKRRKNNPNDIITVVHWDTIEKFYNAVKSWSKNNNLSIFNEILVIAHWNNEALSFNPSNINWDNTITKDNLFMLPNISDSWVNMKIIWCNTWEWINSISYQIWKEMWLESVIAPNWFIRQLWSFFQFVDPDNNPFNLNSWEYINQNLFNF
jgi:RHS repeat-associated protein